MFDSLQARPLRRKTERDDAELLERLTRLARTHNVVGSAGEFGLLFTSFAYRPEAAERGRNTLHVAELDAVMANLRLPDGWEASPKSASDWVQATTRIAAFAVRARLRRNLGRHTT